MGRYGDGLLRVTGGPWNRRSVEASQVFSIEDKSTNYCNLRNLVCGSAEGCTPVPLATINVTPTHGAVGRTT